MRWRNIAIVFLLTMACEGGAPAMSVFAANGREGEAAIAALIAQRNEAVRELLLRVRSSDHDDGKARVRAARALADLGAVEVVPILVRDIAYEPNTAIIVIEESFVFSEYPFVSVLLHHNLRCSVPREIVKHLRSMHPERVCELELELFAHVVMEIHRSRDCGYDEALAVIKHAYDCTPDAYYGKENLNRLQDVIKMSIAKSERKR